MAKSKLKSQGANIPVPQDDSEARSAIKEMGDLQREKLRIEAEMNDKLAEIKAEYGERADPLNDQITAKQEGLRIFAEANRDRLTKGGKVKYHRFETGEISWRNRPAKVSLRKVDDVIAAIKAAGLKNKFLRVKEEVNKDAMLEEKHRAIAAGITGVSIGSDGEDFIVEPYETELQEAS
jgi:phage host-nuclease inhibitor protein Gam